MLVKGLELHVTLVKWKTSFEFIIFVPLCLFIRKRFERFFHFQPIVFVVICGVTLRSASGHYVATGTSSHTPIHLLHLCGYLKLLGCNCIKNMNNL